MLQCLMIAGHIFLATPDIMLNIDNGFSSVYFSGDNLRVITHFDGEREGVTIEAKELRDVGIVARDVTVFANWCYKQVEPEAAPLY